MSGSLLPLPAPVPLESCAQVLRQHPDAARWLEQQPPLTSELLQLRIRFAAVGRRLPAILAAPSIALAAHWHVVDWARLWLLQQFNSGLDVAAQRAAVRVLYERGELGEQESLLRCLWALPHAAEHVDTAIEACRHNALSVFEAIACANPYPASCFPELNFNQMLLKAVFNAVPLARVLNWQQRVTPELQRMALGTASERRAAGRDVPADLNALIQTPVR